jgi:2,3-bisphosphoglycerate-independent phosphoglycerate mutase
MPIIDKIKKLYFVALTNFGPDLDVHSIWPGQTVAGTLPMALGSLRQLYIAESEKYAHITYFLNGGYAEPVSGEDRQIVPSPKIDSYAKMPQMAAHHITQHVLQSLEKNKHDFIAVNFANTDMVGHTGDLAATIRATEVVDEQIKIIAEEVLRQNGNLIITADHGNAEDMFDFKVKQPNTFHTKNPVPFLLIGERFKHKKLSAGILGNIAPTILDILEIEKPIVMKKDSLIRK